MNTKLLVVLVCTNISICFVRTLPMGSLKDLPCRELRAIGEETKLACVVESGVLLDYRHIRELTSAGPSNEKFNISIVCNGGKVFLPWPFRARNVIALKVERCRVEGFLAERTHGQASPDELRAVHLLDNVLEVTIQQLHDSLVNLSNMTKDFECGPINVRENVFRNIRYNFPMVQDDMTNILLMEKLVSGEGLKTIVNHNAACVYPYLTYLEESGIDSLSSVHFKLAEENKYPELRTYSIRNNSLGRIPDELKNLPVKFLPNLEKMDLSNNKIETLDFTFSSAPVQGKMVNIDMRNNALRQITAPFLYKLLKSKIAVFDLRDNPITCSCSLYLYSMYLEQLSQDDPSLSPLRDINCSHSFRDAGGVAVIERRKLNPAFGASLCIEK